MIKKTILGLDIGSSKISACLCDVSPDGDIQIRGVGTFPSIGMVKGRLDYPDELKRSIRKALQRTELNAGVSAESVLTTVPFFGVSSVFNSASVATPGSLSVITDAQKTDCLKLSKNIQLDASRTVLHMIPLQYKVDHQVVTQPVGISGKQLEVKTHILTTQTDIISKVSSTLNGLSLHISGLLYEPLASAQVYLSEEERKEGVWLLDIGGRFSKLSLFKHNLLQKTIVVPIGGDTFTSDLAYCLSVTHTDAERVKLIYGDIQYDHLDPDETVKISPADKNEVNRQKICQILEARAQELVRLLKKEFDTVPSASYKMVLAGNGSKLTGLKEFLSQAFGLTVQEGLSDAFKSVVHAADHASALGAIIYGLKNNAISFPKAPQPDVFGRFNKWIRDFV